MMDRGKQRGGAAGGRSGNNGPLALAAERDLVRAAAAAARRAYAPYSKFRVGAALLAADGRVFRACNMENASYGLTLCAERAAFAAAIAAGATTFKGLAVVAGGKKPVYPCGACLQVMAEFCGPDFPVRLASLARPGTIAKLRLEDLLPKAFTFRKGRRG